MKICGIDEAGRGPVLGPLVMAGVVINEEDIPKLEELGVKDSKLLTPEKREELFEKVKEIAIDFKIKSVSPLEIDNSLKSENSNLNWLEADTSSQIVNQFGSHKVIVDCPSVNVSAYKDYFLNKLENQKVELVVEHKADFNYIVVAAASILAKVTRDRELEEIKKKLNIDFGSGYPTDPKTQEFLQNNFDKEEYSHIFRKTWSSHKKLVDGKAQKSLGEF